MNGWAGRPPGSDRLFPRRSSGASLQWAKHSEMEKEKHAHFPQIYWLHYINPRLQMSKHY